MPEKNRFPAVLVPVTSNGDSVSPTLDASHNQKWGSNQWVNSGFGIITEGTPSLRASGGDVGGGSEVLVATEPFGYRVHSENSNAAKAGDCSLADPAEVARALDQHGGYSAGQGGNVIVQDVTHALTGEGFDASEDGTGRGTPIIPCLFDGLPDEVVGSDAIVAFNMHKSGSKHSTLGMSIDRTDCLRAFDKSPMVAYSEPMAFNTKRDGADCAGISPTLCGMNSKESNPNSGGQVGIVVNEPIEPVGQIINGPLEGTQVPLRRMAVRRLTPRECERLQGFPDDYTKIAYRGKPADKCPDGPRYKAIGNSWAVPVVRWIGRRIDQFLKAESGLPSGLPEENKKSDRNCVDEPEDGR